jgi:hypothetical protein
MVPYGLGYVVFHGGKLSEGSPPQSLGSLGIYSLTRPEEPLKPASKNPQTELSHDSFTVISFNEKVHETKCQQPK